MKNSFIYEEVNDMTADTLFALIFLGIAFVGYTIGMLDYMGVFDRLAIKLTNYIVSRIERLEKDI